MTVYSNMPLQVDCETPRGKIVSIPIRPNSREGTEIAFRSGVRLLVQEYAHHRFGVVYFKDQFIVHPGPDRGTSFEMVERSAFDGINRRGVVWNFSDIVPVDVECTIPPVKGQRRRFVRARIWTLDMSRESDPR